MRRLIIQAMAAGVADHIWTVEEIAGLLEAFDANLQIV